MHENCHGRVHSINVDHGSFHKCGFVSFPLDWILYFFSGMGVKRLWKIGGAIFFLHLIIKKIMWNKFKWKIFKAFMLWSSGWAWVNLSLTLIILADGNKVLHVFDGNKVLLIYFYKCFPMQYLHILNDSEWKKNTTVLIKIVLLFL